MQCIDIVNGLLQSTYTSGSNGIIFVILSVLVTEPFDAKLHILVHGRNLLKMGRGFRADTKIGIRKLKCHFLIF